MKLASTKFYKYPFDSTRLVTDRLTGIAKLAVFILQKNKMYYRTRQNTNLEVTNTVSGVTFRRLKSQ